MKKNITINLCGRLFQIDEDAYELLQHYIESLRHSFGKSEGGDEIVDDIEARIAELFTELREQGNEAITIDHVKAIISRIGEPEQLRPTHTDNGQNCGAQHEYIQRNRTQLYRLVAFIQRQFPTATYGLHECTTHNEHHTPLHTTDTQCFPLPQ
jgi:hypothetical protein